MKPDWATRLQRTFARKYDAGFAKGLMLGKAVGARDEQERIVELIKGFSICAGGSRHEYDCLCELIDLINGTPSCYCIGTWKCPNHESLIKGEK